MAQAAPGKLLLFMLTGYSAAALRRSKTVEVEGCEGKFEPVELIRHRACTKHDVVRMPPRRHSTEHYSAAAYCATAAFAPFSSSV